LGGARSGGGKRAGPTIYELNAHGEQRSAREIPRLVAAGALLVTQQASASLDSVWPSGPRRTVAAARAEQRGGCLAAIPSAAQPSADSREPRSSPDPQRDRNSHDVIPGVLDFDVEVPGTRRGRGAAERHDVVSRNAQREPRRNSSVDTGKYGQRQLPANNDGRCRDRLTHLSGNGELASVLAQLLRGRNGLAVGLLQCP